MPAAIASLLMLLCLPLVTGAEAVPSHGQASPAAEGARAAAFVPDTVFRLPGGPTIAFFEAGASEAVSIRVAVPFAESPAEAGVGQLLRIQAQARMDALAERIGAHVEVHRTPGALAYQVSGSVQDLDFLAWILREGMAAPEERRFDPARRQVLAELERRVETPEGTLALRILEGLAPGMASIQGSFGTLERMQNGHLAAAWARSHVRSQLRVVAVGRVEPTLLLAALSDLGLPESGPVPERPPPESTGEPRGQPEVIRHWVARGYPVDLHTGARALVAARHLAGRLRDDPGDYEAAVELWELGGDRALVISGAAYDRSQQAMRSRIEGLLDEGIVHLTDAAVSDLATGLRAEIRIAGRTPWGLADLVGQAWDSGEGPDGTGRLLDELRGVEAADVRRFLEALQGRTPVIEELRP